jgi:hypothetical protein
VLKTELTDFAGDVETIRHPKNDLKNIAAALRPTRSFDEVEDGKLILQQLDIGKVLSKPETCRSLRTAYAWCCRAMGLEKTELFRLSDGQLYSITSSQLDDLAP